MAALRFLLLFLAAWTVAETASAQRVRSTSDPSAALRMSRGPYYAEVPIVLQLQIEGFSKDPAPEITAGQVPENAELQLISLSPNHSSMVRIVNGRRQAWERTSWVANYELILKEPGSASTPTFAITQGSKSAAVGSRRVVASEVPLSDQIGIELILPERPVFPGQRVPIQIIMKLAVGLQDKVSDYTIRSPLAALLGDFSFVDQPLKRGDQALKVSAGEENLTLLRTTEQKQVNGRRELWLSATRTMIPVRPGTYEISPSSLVVEEVTRWGRANIFGDRSPAETRLLLAKDLPRRIVVRELPRVGKPASFGGAVGRGFSLAVEADRTVVRTGDPIELTLTLSGDGNLPSAGLPDLAKAGLSPDLFSLNASRPAGLVEEGKKVFSVTIRADQAGISELPPIEYSWFDPEAEAYRSTTSDPIALSVKQGETVGTSSIVGMPTTPEGTDAEIIPQPTARPRFVLEGADLSIERDPQRLLIREQNRLGGLNRPWLAGAVGLLLIALSLVSRWRDRTSPEVRERRTQLAAASRELSKINATSADELRTVVGTLRTMEREVKLAGGTIPADLDEFIREVENRIYAPAAEGSEGDVLTRARTLARALEEAGR